MAIRENFSNFFFVKYLLAFVVSKPSLMYLVESFYRVYENCGDKSCRTGRFRRAGGISIILEIFEI